jgi:SAM-dependent methyltransferase
MEPRWKSLMIIENENELIRDISPNDEMFAYSQNDLDFYWKIGRSAIECISRSMATTGKRASDVTRILDFPCGHGRITRYLKLAFPHAEITACDLLKDGVDFCASTFGAVPVYSHKDPSRIGLPEKAFDLIWVGSLLTHFDAAHWSGFLKLFVSSLREDGLLVFSAHGRIIYLRLKGIDPSHNYGLPYWRDTLICHSYERKGFGYAYYRKGDEYGISLSDMAWVCDRIREMPELEMVHFSAGAWHGFHDIYACRKLPDSGIVETSSGLYWAHKMRDLAPAWLVRVAKTVGFKVRRA